MKKYAKIAALLMAFVLVIAGTVGVTMALLTDKTESVTNTFTIGQVEITLKETTGDSYKLVPATEVAKDPKVTVVAGSEDCYLFIKIDKAAALEGVVSYVIADGWTQLEIDGAEVAGVYYMIVDDEDGNGAKGTAYSVLKDDQITVENVDAETLADITNTDTLTFTAYACQTANTTLKAAWTAVSALA